MLPSASIAWSLQSQTQPSETIRAGGSARNPEKPVSITASKECVCPEASSAKRGTHASRREFTAPVIMAFLPSRGTRIARLPGGRSERTKVGHPGVVRSTARKPAAGHLRGGNRLYQCQSPQCARDCPARPKDE